MGDTTYVHEYCNKILEGRLTEEFVTHRRALSSPAPARRCEVLAPREGTRVIPPCRSSTMRVSRLKGGNQEEEEFIIQFGYGINDY